MHPRNIYKTPPDFNELARLFPEFAKIAKLDVNGKLRIDFKDLEAARVFTKCCLQKDFQLNINLPTHKLLPTLPLRLNYIHWLEDLLEQCEITNEVTGVDIGCGASCIYCLLAVRVNKNWKMIALECDDENVNFAKENISTNQLNDSVSVVHQQGDLNIFKKLFESNPHQKSFCMCNPPFFSSSEEVFNSENRTGNRKRPHSQNAGTSSELIYEDGGEFGFVTKILNESLQLREKIQIYSTMLGCKKNLQRLIDELRRRNIQNFTTTEFIQGKTTRWGLAWSFIHKLESLKCSRNVFKKSSALKNVLTYEISTNDFEETISKLRNIFKDLRIQIKVIEESAKRFYRWELTAKENTWSNQRRKRRAEQKETNSPEQNLSSQDLQLGFELQSKGDIAQLRMFFISGNMSKDSTNQILQLIKNKFK